MTVVEHTSQSTTEARVLGLTRELIRTRSTDGAAGAGRVLEVLRDYLEEGGVKAKLLSDGGRSLALLAVLDSGKPGPTLCLNACADTAPIGDERLWSFAPLGAEIHDGWLYGRGAADSKAGAAIFAEVARRWRESPSAGRLVVAFDGDEHSGRFNGIALIRETAPKLDAVMIGYPGHEAIRVGARGFWRASITVFGVGQHSGSRKAARNAILKAARLTERLAEQAEKLGESNIGAQLTVTGIRGGSGYSSVPDSCVLRVDVRLSAGFSVDDARQIVGECVSQVDIEMPFERETTVRDRGGLPAYEMQHSDRVVEALSRAAESVLHHRVGLKVAGPSNVGNLFASDDIPATCGFGVIHRNVHASDEAVKIESFIPTVKIYERAVSSFLSDGS